MHGNGPTEPQLQVVITGGWCVAKKKGTYIQRTPPPMEKKKGKKKNCKKKKVEKKEEVPSTVIDLANFDLIV